MAKKRGEPVASDNGFGITDKDRKHLHALAHRLMCAYISHYAGVAYRTYEDTYAGGRDGESWEISREKGIKLPGPYWYWLAGEVQRQHTELRSLEIEIQQANQKAVEREKAGLPNPTPKQFVRRPE